MVICVCNPLEEETPKSLGLAASKSSRTSELQANKKRLCLNKQGKV